MPFFVDDEVHAHPKFDRAGNAAIGAWVRMGSWCHALRPAWLCADRHREALRLGARAQGAGDVRREGSRPPRQGRRRLPVPRVGGVLRDGRCRGRRRANPRARGRGEAQEEECRAKQGRAQGCASALGCAAQCECMRRRCAGGCGGMRRACAERCAAMRSACGAYAERCGAYAERIPPPPHPLPS